MPDDEAPTILLERTQADEDPKLLQRCAPGVMELLGLIELSDTLQLALIYLAGAVRWDESPPGAVLVVLVAGGVLLVRRRTRVR